MSNVYNASDAPSAVPGEGKTGFTKESSHLEAEDDVDHHSIALATNVKAQYYSQDELG